MSSDLSAWIYKQVYCRLIGSVLPVSWFGPTPPATLPAREGRLSLEIVAHCWQYANFAVYQLSSLVNHPPESLDVHYTLYYAEEDAGTAKLVETFSAIELPNIHWQWRPIPRDALYRRAIGRNHAALNSKADWLWFADCDLIFHQHCLDSLAQVLQGRSNGLLFPASEQITELLPADHPMVNLPIQSPQLVDIDPSIFRRGEITKAKGAFQIVHGDLARVCGYCKDLKHYQSPTQRWRKTFEDTAFRRLIEDEGTPIPVRGLHRIRHQEKGRYAKGSVISQVRQSLRRISEKPGSDRE